MSEVEIVLKNRKAKKILAYLSLEAFKLLIYNIRFMDLDNINSPAKKINKPDILVIVNEPEKPDKGIRETNIVQIV